MRRSNRQSGFTLVEVAIVMPIVMLLIAGMVALLFAMLSDFNNGKVKQTLQYQNQAALETIEHDIKLSSAFLTEQDPSPMNPDFFGYSANAETGPPAIDPSTAYCKSVEGTIYYRFCSPSPRASSPLSYKGDSFSATNARSLLLRNYATTLDTNNPDRRAVIKQKNAAGDYIQCNDSPYLTNALSYNISYFVRSGDLYRRVVTSSEPSCDQQYQKQSCPEQATDFARNIGLCKDGVNDSKLLTGVTEFSVDYYQTPTSTSAMSVYRSYNPDAPSDAQTAVVTITTTGKDTKGGPISVDSSIRASKGN